MYVLDTNTLIYFFKGKGRVAGRMLVEAPANIGIPSIVVYELETGIAKSASPLKRTRQLKALLQATTLLPFNINSMNHLIINDFFTIIKESRFCNKIY